MPYRAIARSRYHLAQKVVEYAFPILLCRILGGILLAVLLVLPA